MGLSLPGTATAMPHLPIVGSTPTGIQSLGLPTHSKCQSTYQSLRNSEMNTENKVGQAHAIKILEVQKLLPTVHKVNIQKRV